MDNVLSQAIGLGNSLECTIEALAKRFDIYFIYLRYKEFPIWWGSIPWKKWRSSRVIFKCKLRVKSGNQINYQLRISSCEQYVIHINKNNQHISTKLKKKHGGINLRLFETQTSQWGTKFSMSGLWCLLKTIKSLLQLTHIRRVVGIKRAERLHHKHIFSQVTM